MFSNQSVSVHWLWLGPAPTAHGVRPFALYFFVIASSCAHVFGTLKLVLLERVGLVPDDALRVGLGRDAVELPARATQLQPAGRVVALHVRIAETERRERLQRALLRECRDVARPRQDPDLRRITGCEPRPDLRDEVTSRGVVDLDARRLRKGVSHLQKCVLLASAPERENLDGIGTSFRRFCTDRCRRQSGGDNGKCDGRRNQRFPSHHSNPPPS